MHNICFATRKGKQMPPKVKFQKQEIVQAAFEVARTSGLENVTAREVASRLEVSPRPIFTYYSTMDQLKHDVYVLAKQHYGAYIRKGLTENIPFLGVGKQYIRFAKEEPQLYRMLFLTKRGTAVGGTMEAMEYTLSLVQSSIMEIYSMDERQAAAYFRNMWLVCSSIATLIVTGECPYSDKEIVKIMSEVSLAICKAYKEVPGLTEGTVDKDSIFKDILGENK